MSTDQSAGFDVLSKAKGSFQISIIIPTFKEKEIIEDSITRIMKNLADLAIKAEVVVVDDSPDETITLLKKLAPKFANMSLIHRRGGKGVGSAIRLGIAHAQAKYGLIFMSDAPDDIKYVPSILTQFEKGYDFVHTSRFMKGSKIIGYAMSKTIANRLCNWLVRVAFFHFSLKDFTSLFKGFDIEKVKKLKLEANEFDIGLEIVLKAIRRRYRIIEVPVSWKEREAGKSKLQLSVQGPEYIKRISKIFFLYW